MTLSARRIVTRSPEETQALAASLARELGPGSVLALHGELGSGKTCFVQGLAMGLGVTEPVNSPTYTLVNEYRGSLPLYHVDLYRIRQPSEVLSLGLDEYLYGDGVVAVEWAERAESLLPAGCRHVTFEPGSSPDERVITVRGSDAP